MARIRWSGVVLCLLVVAAAYGGEFAVVEESCLETTFGTPAGRAAGPVITASEITAADIEFLSALRLPGGARQDAQPTAENDQVDVARYENRKRLSILNEDIEYEAFTLMHADGQTYDGMLVFSTVPKAVRERLAAVDVNVPWSVLTLASGAASDTIRLGFAGQGPAEEFRFTEARPAVASRSGEVEANISDSCISCVKTALGSAACEAAGIALACATGIGCPGSIMAAVVKSFFGGPCEAFSLGACVGTCAIPTITLTPGSNSTFAPSNVEIRLNVSGGVQAGTWLAVMRGADIVHFKGGVGSTDVTYWPASPGTYRILGGNVPLFGFPWVKSSTNVTVATANVGPNASFTFATNGLTASFADRSTDPDGSIVSRTWNFGDGTTSTLANPTKTYASAGTRTVALTVRDNGGKSATTSKAVTVSTTSSCTTYSGSLGYGGQAVQPLGNFYESTAPGTQYGKLTGPAGADFDLFLYRWNGSAWLVVSSSTSSGATETISYNGTAGFYYWRVLAYSGSGAYSLCMSKP